MNLKISYNWFKEYLKTNQSVFDVAKELSLKGMSVERIETVAPSFKNIITAKILEITKHPNADKLKLVTIDTGKEKLTVVCGALNILPGQIVPFAQIGAEVKSPDKEDETWIVTAAKIRGVESQGMLCSQKELGLGQDHTGIMILSDNTPVGKPLAEVIGPDYIFDVEITSNRPDAMSVVGLAREAAAALSIKLNWQEPKPNLKVINKLPLTVEVKEPKLCSRYLGVVMTEVKVGPSPHWLQLRLLASGLRPINNLVDITNYIQLEYGRPLHVFDYDKINGNKIIVRQAKAGEKILALDGKTYDLKTNHLVIADSKVPVAIAGIMGGEESAATEKTKTIIFEAAIFDPVLTRKTVREINLRSDSSDLFEKGLQPHSAMVGILRAIELTQEIAGGKVASQIVDSQKSEIRNQKIKFDTSIIKKHLGVKISLGQIKKILQSLGFTAVGTKTLTVTVPWWRAGDVVYDYDLTEEVARIYGYHNLPTHLPTGQIPVQTKDPVFLWESLAKNCLSGLGFCEVYNYSMVSEKFLAKTKFNLGKMLAIANPLNEEMTMMRTTLMSGILQNISDNINNFSELNIFELSNVYLPKGQNELPAEILKLSGAIVTNSNNSFFVAKGTVELLLKKMGIGQYELKLTDQNCPLWQVNRALDIYIDENYVGQFGLIKQDILDNFGITKAVALFDFDFLQLIKFATTVRAYQPLPEFPSVSRDLAIIIDAKLAWQEINQLVSQFNKIIVGVEYLNTFVGKELETNKKSLAFRVTFRSSQKTLKAQEVDDIISDLIKKLAEKFDAKLR
ncbi:MAG: phenylalanine--tRNA ligase subunit beta [Patescibacteria group bacterium]